MKRRCTVMFQHWPAIAIKTDNITLSVDSCPGYRSEADALGADYSLKSQYWGNFFKGKKNCDLNFTTRERKRKTKI